MAEVTVQLQKVNKYGVAFYKIPGVPMASIRVSKGALSGEQPPAELTLQSDALKQPDPERAAKLAARGERQQKTAASAEERLAKLNALQEKYTQRQQKAQERARKIQERIEKNRAKAGGQPAEQPETVGAAQ